MRLGHGQQVGQDPRYIEEAARHFDQAVKTPRTDPGRETSLLELMSSTVFEVDSIRRKVDVLYAYLFGATPCDEACGSAPPSDIHHLALRTHVTSMETAKELDDIISRLAE